MKRILSILFGGLNFAFWGLVIAAGVAFLSAPVFFGVAVITAGTVATVWAWTAIAGAFGMLVRFFTTRQPTVILNRRSTDNPTVAPTSAPVATSLKTAKKTSRRGGGRAIATT